MSELRVVLLGDSWSDRSSVAKFLLGQAALITKEEPDRCVQIRGLIQRTNVVLINTPDILYTSEHTLREHVQDCIRLSAPGPHVFLLVLQSETFTELHKGSLIKVLELFSNESFNHSLVLISTPRERSSHLHENVRNLHRPPLQDMIRRCSHRSMRLAEFRLSELLRNMRQIIETNYGRHVLCDHPSMRCRTEARVPLGSAPSVGKSQ